MYKTIQPPGNDMVFRSIAANTETKVCFGHIRAASGTAIATVNNHPFIFGRHCTQSRFHRYHRLTANQSPGFMHNGVISDFTLLRRQLSTHISDAAFARIHGSTDSEHIAALYLSLLTANGAATAFEKPSTLDGMTTALQATLRTILTLQHDILGPTRKRPNSLNLCATDGINLVACRFRNHATSQPPTLYYSTRAGVTLNRKYPDVAEGGFVKGVSDSGLPEEQHGRHVIVASEPSTYRDEDWELMPKNSVLGVDAKGEVEVRMLEGMGREWDAKDWGE